MWVPRPNAAHDDRVDRDSRALTDFIATSEGLELVKAFMGGQRPERSPSHRRTTKAAVRRVGPPRTERSNNDYPNRSLSSLPGNHTEIEDAANRVHFFPFVRQGIRHPR